MVDMLFRLSPEILRGTFAVNMKQQGQDGNAIGQNVSVGPKPGREGGAKINRLIADRPAL